MTEKTTMQIDIVSDVVCPWCIVGYKKLLSTLPQFEDQLDFEITWHPFELNPQMGPEGENQREHIMRKYGSTQEQSEAARQRLTDIGAELGFTFNYRDDMRVVNTFKAHQLLHWAREKGKQTDLKLAFFDTYFTRLEDVSKDEILIAAVERAGLDGNEAQAVLDDGRCVQAVRQNQQFWIQNKVQGVPAQIIDRKYLISGAQDPSVIAQVINKALEDRQAAA